jgi:ferric-dicitrate binding protein FerR (iron transport regulator)
MNEDNELSSSEQQLSALLDGELDEQEITSLKDAASQDPEFARALEQTLALKAALTSIPKRRAPASLEQKLQAISRRRIRQRSGWLAIAATVLVLVAVGSWQPGNNSDSADSLELALQDLNVAFGYLQRINRKTGHRIEISVVNGLNRPLSTVTVRALNEHLGVMEE